MPRHDESTLAIKQATDIVALVGEYLTLHRSGGKFKALCPFHDDHNPSLELNSERQAYKCWSCGAGGDVFKFVQDYERVDFSEAKRMLADRAGIVLDRLDARTSALAATGPSKTELLAVCAWAETAFAAELSRSDEGQSYAAKRGISAESLATFRLGFAPDSRDWLTIKARKMGYGTDLLEAAGLVKRKEEGSNLFRDRFRGRLIFPIHDARGRAIAFGGRILPDSEKRLADAGLGVAKYLNSPETPLFQKRRNLYAADLARGSARSEGWVAVVEGYTDVIAAHQAGLTNVVGTLGTALGDDHVRTLRGFDARVVLIFDGDEAGQKAADRSLELFLGHEVDVRVLTLPDDLDPADFLADRGADAFRALVDRAGDPLAFILDRAASRYDFQSAEGARQAAQWVLSILAKVPRASRGGLDLKVAKALDTLSRRIGVPVNDLKKGLRRESRPRPSRVVAEPTSAVAVSEELPPIRLRDLDPLDRELVEIALHAPEAAAILRRGLPIEELRDAPLRVILGACYDALARDQTPDFASVAPNLSDRERALAASLVMPADPAPMPEKSAPAPWGDRLPGLLSRIELRQWRQRQRDLEEAMRETDRVAHPDEYRALHAEYHRVLKRAPGAKKT